jgi:hypothetical protein
MNDREYAEWIIKDTWQQLRPALIGYAIVLTLYWTVIG